VSDFLLELRCEEIPARMQAKARADLQKLFTDKIAEAGLSADAIAVYSTPRRLALVTRGLPDQTEAVSDERKGPRADAPEKAIEGFLRSTGLTRGQLVERDVKGQAVLFAVIEKPGRATREVLAEAIPAIIRAFPWPKSMRWGPASHTTESLRWVRPLSGIVAILGDDLVPCNVDGIASGYETVGHRFHHQGFITIGNADDYLEKLRACHVIVDQAEREALIRKGAAEAAADAGLVLVEDEGLVVENAGLTEWPVLLLGSYDPAFLDVPEEVIQLTTRINQKYFVCRDQAGVLAPNFVCTANIAAHDGGKAIVAGNEKVLAARLSDAKFFWELDQKKTLAKHAEKLKDIVFHEKLGTVADKVERVAKLARWLCEEGIVKPSPDKNRHPELVSGSQEMLKRVQHDENGGQLSTAQLANMAEQAARLCKADLVTEMVGEFPELQGVMGGYYAAKEGLPIEVSNAIRDHYKPVGQGDDVPTDPVTVAVSLADKLDTIASFFAIDEKPTGSKDPFALRRAAYGVLLLLMKNRLRMSIIIRHDRAWLNARAIMFFWSNNISRVESDWAESVARESGKISDFLMVFDRSEGSEGADGHVWRTSMLKAYERFQLELLTFFADRLKVQQREAGVRHDLIDAVFALGGEDDLVRLLDRVKALQSFVETEDGVNLLAGYKRAANILKKEGWSDAGAPVMAGRDDQGIAQTGEEDPLSMVEDPIIAEAVAEMANQKGASFYTPDPAEADLIAALDAAEPKAEAAIAAEDFEGAMAALASLRAPIDAFFENVTVNDTDPDKRNSRLALLARIRAAVHKVADFSKIEG